MTELLSDCWRNKEVRERIKTSIINGDFKSRPELGEKIIQMMELSYTYDSSDECMYDLLHGILKKENFQDDLVAHFEQKAKKRALQINTILNKKIAPIVNSIYLDYGCGNGIVTSEIVKVLEKHDINRCLGVDLNWDAPSDINFHYAPKSGLTVFGDNIYGLVTCLTVAHHFTEPLAELKSIYKMLAPGGMLIFRDFDAASDEDKIFNFLMDEMLYRAYYGDSSTPVTDSYFSKESWAWLLKQAGFSVKRQVLFDGDKGNPYKPFYLIALKNPE